MSPTSHFFFVGKQKTVLTLNQFANVVKKYVWPYFQSRRKKIRDCFLTVRQSYLISLYHMHAVFIAFVACDVAFVAFVACKKCNIAFVASIFYPTPFLVILFIPRRRGGSIIARTMMTMNTDAATIAASKTPRWEGEGGEKTVASLGGRLRACVDVGHRRGRLLC